MSGLSRFETVHLLNAEFAVVTLESSVEAILDAIRRGERGWLATVNVAILMMMRDDPALQRYVQRATWVVADGQPIVWLSRLLRRPLPGRVTGVDLIESLCERAEADGLTVYMLGGNDEVIRKAASTLLERHPALKLYFNDGYFNAQQEEERAQMIAASGASILFVGMGVPRQEAFIMKHWDALGANVAIGVGGSFDVLGGLRRRAPVLLQRSGLEWFYRLVQEPNRLWRRYLVTGVQFTALGLRAVIGERSSRRGLGGRTNERDNT